MATLTKGKTFGAEFIRAGVVKYDNEVILIREENLDRIAQAFEGVPIIIGHEIITEDNVDNLKVGIAGKTGNTPIYNGFRTIDIIIDNDEGLQAINGGAKVSWSGRAAKTLDGGTYNNVPYDREIVEIEGLHIGLVDDPRYEEATIYENSKSSDKEDDNNLIKAAMFNIFNNSKKEKDMDLENTKILVNGETFQASDLFDNSKDGLVLKTNVLDNEKEDKKDDEDKKDNEKKEDEKDMKDNQSEKEAEDEAEKKEKAKRNESEDKEEEDKKDEKDNVSETYKMANGEEKTMKEVLEMANKFLKMSEKKNEEKKEDKEKAKDNSKKPIGDALNNSISSYGEKKKESGYIPSDKGQELGSKLF